MYQHKPSNQSLNEETIFSKGGIYISDTIHF